MSKNPEVCYPLKVSPYQSLRNISSVVCDIQSSYFFSLNTIYQSHMLLLSFICRHTDFTFISVSPALAYLCLGFQPTGLITSWAFQSNHFSPLSALKSKTLTKETVSYEFHPGVQSSAKIYGKVYQEPSCLAKGPFFWTQAIITRLLPGQFSVLLILFLALLSSNNQARKIRVYITYLNRTTFTKILINEGGTQIPEGKWGQELSADFSILFNILSFY